MLGIQLRTTVSIRIYYIIIHYNFCIKKNFYFAPYIEGHLRSSRRNSLQVLLYLCCGAYLFRATALLFFEMKLCFSKDSAEFELMALPLSLHLLRTFFSEELALDLRPARGSQAEAMLFDQHGGSQQGYHEGSFPPPPCQLPPYYKALLSFSQCELLEGLCQSKLFFI